MSKQDRQGVRTASDLERKYDLGSIKKTDNRSREDIAKINQSMAQFMTEIRNKIEQLESGAVDLSVVYPVGSVYVSVNSTDPSTLFVGTWERFAKGCVLVGVNEDDDNLSESLINGNMAMAETETSLLQPYVTCYMWRRTA